MLRFVQEVVRTLHVAVTGLRQRDEVDGVAFGLLVALSLALAGLLYGLEPLWDALTEAAGLGESPGPWSFVVPLGAVVLVLGLIWWRYRRTRRGPVGLRAPEPKRGLVFLLSPFAPQVGLDAVVPRGPAQAALASALGLPDDVEGLARLLAAPPDGLDLRRALLASNWGYLYAAVEAHRTALEHLWLVTTPGSAPQADLAAAVARAALGDRPGGLRFETSHGRFLVRDESDIGEVASAVGYVYDTLPPGLPEREVVTDLTGGTAIMTAGAVLATLGPRRPLQYGRQGPERRLLLDDGGTIRARSPEEIAEARCLVEVKTDVSLVRLRGRNRG